MIKNECLNKKYSLTAIDLFCGIGGMTHGLIKAGIKVIAGIDTDITCKYAYERNNKTKFINRDIRDITGAELTEMYPQKECYRILVGCAPCQPFSKHTQKNSKRTKDEKWNLLNSFARLIRETEPDIISMENVPQIEKQKIFTTFIRNLKKHNYHISWQFVFCPDYGIPQTRTRLVLLASKFGKIELLNKTTVKAKYKTVKETIGELEQICAGQTSRSDSLHRACHFTDINMKRIKQSKPGGSWRDWDESLLLQCHKKETGKTYPSVYGRMRWNEPAPTITTQFYNYGTGRFGHPVQDRALSLREGALLQTFPIDYKFVDQSNGAISIKKLGIHIGNAVPVRLAEIIGKSIVKHLETNHAK